MSITAVTFMVGGDSGGALAQITIPTLFPPPTPAPPTTAPATPPTTASLVGSLLNPPTTPAPTKAAPTTIPSGGTIGPGKPGGQGEAAVPADAGPFPADLAAKMRSVRRSGPRSSDQLMDALKALTDLGVPLDEAMRVGMGRFPIAGRTNFVNDWWFPRFGPGWRLHEGTDMFAERSTPLRSPATGTVRFSDGGLGGISLYVTQSDGTYFYLTHLDRRAEGLKEGQQVVTGDIVGFVGSTGNAAGGSPHLHFEVHPAVRIVTVGKGKKAVTKAVSAPVKPGTVLAPIDPKPLLDLWLQEALDALPAIVASHQARIPVAAPPVGDAGTAVPASVVLASHASSGGLIAADAPLARTPLLGLAFLLIVMVVVLTPVLAPRGRPSPLLAVGRAAAKRDSRRKKAPRAGRRAGGKGPVQPALPVPPAPVTVPAAKNGTGPGTRKRGLRKRGRAPDGPAPPLVGAAPGDTAA